MVLCLVFNLGNANANEHIATTVGQAIEIGFTELERQLINHYFDGETDPPARSGIVFNNTSLQKKKEQALPPGLAKKKELPPGLAAQLQRNGTLPPGLARRNLPADLTSQLPPVRPGYERSILDDLTVVLVETATQTIVDIIFDTVTATDGNTTQEK
jgi:hypothetical protein